jgi:hypothetical protein
MAASYDEAVAELYQGPHASFVTERKRLAAALKDAGDKAGATKLGKLPRPPISAWTVNQLWWQARDTFESMLESAAALREGDLGVTSQHRETIAKLRQRAHAILTEAGNAASEATLRRVTTTLAAIAATGGFGPDPDGALGDDRDPPGFEAIGIGSVPLAAPTQTTEPAKATRSKKADDDDEADPAKREAAEARRRDAEEARARAEAEQARRKAEEAAAKRRTERHRLEAAIRNERGEIEAKRREVERLGKQIGNLEESILQAEAAIADIEKRLVELGDE